MRQKMEATKPSAEKVIKDIRRITRKQYGAEEKIRIVLDGLRGEESIAALCRREGISESLYYNWSKEFLEAGKKRLAGDTARAATSDEVKVLRKEARDLKEVVAEQALELRILKKTYGSPRLQAFCSFGSSICTNVSRLKNVSWPRWSSAHSDPHKHDGDFRHFFNQAFEMPFDCQAIFTHPPADIKSLGRLRLSLTVVIKQGLLLPSAQKPFRSAAQTR